MTSCSTGAIPCTPLSSTAVSSLLLRGESVLTLSRPEYCYSGVRYVGQGKSVVCVSPAGVVPHVWGGVMCRTSHRASVRERDGVHMPNMSVRYLIVLKVVQALMCTTCISHATGGKFTLSGSVIALSRDLVDLVDEPASHAMSHQHVRPYAFSGRITSERQDTLCDQTVSL